MLRTWSGPGPTSELSCQNVADPEPGGPYPSRTKREPIRPMLDEPGSEPDMIGAGQDVSESDGAGAQHIEERDGS